MSNFLIKLEITRLAGFLTLFIAVTVFSLFYNKSKKEAVGASVFGLVVSILSIPSISFNYGDATIMTILEQAKTENISAMDEKHNKRTFSKETQRKLLALVSVILAIPAVIVATKEEGYKIPVMPYILGLSGVSGWFSCFVMFK